MEPLVSDLRRILVEGTWLLRRLSPYAPHEPNYYCNETPGSPPATVFIRSRRDFGVEPSQIQLPCELLTLFAVLSRLDLQAWRDQVIEVWPALTRLAGDAYKAHKAFVLGVEVAIDQFPVLRATVSSRKMSASYNGIASRVAALLGQDAVATPDPVPVAVVLNFVWTEAEPQARIQREMQEILKLVETMHFHTSMLGPRNQVFCVKEVSIKRVYPLLADIETLECVQQLTALGIVVPTLLGTESRDCSRLLQCVQALLPSYGSKTKSSGVSTLVVSTAAPLESNQAVLSALACGNFVHRIIIEGGTVVGSDTVAKLWRWVGFAIFSHASLSCENLVELQIETQLGEEEIQILRSVVQAEDPLAVLMGENRDPERDDADVSTSQFFLSALSAVSSGPVTAPDFTSSDALTVQVIKKVTGGYSVLLPGFGKAWVRDEHVMSVTPRLSSSRPMASTLDVVFNQLSVESIESAGPLFTLVGDRVISVKIKDIKPPGPYTDESAVWLQELLGACPRLENLDLGSKEVEDLDVFAATPSVPKLRSLAIRSYMNMTDPDDPASPFFAALKSPQHPLASSLEQLELFFIVSAHGSQAFIDMVQRMLDNNSTLKRFMVVVKPILGVRDARAQLEPKLEEWRSADVWLRSDPLPTNSKLAVVGAMARSIAGSQLDSNVFAMVFGFAGHPHRRDFRYALADNFDDDSDDD